ncbi:MAG: DUF1292 domain-containing protein [Erysipelotrichaceae bacterium]|nr:DUF1292 domain-containing protein [Erysipelotrichaceae bacterium]
MENNKITIIEEDGKETVMDILFTFDSEETDKSYVLFTNPEDESGEVFACQYDEEHKLIPIEDEGEYEMIEEVFNTFLQEFDDEEE